MTDQLDSFSDPFSIDPVAPAVNPSATPEQRTEVLVNRMLDDQLTDAEHQELEQLLSNHAPARAVYVDHLQVHFDLQDFFGSSPTVNLPI